MGVTSGSCRDALWGYIRVSRGYQRICRVYCSVSENVLFWVCLTNVLWAIRILTWVVVKIMVPFWVPIIIRHLIFRVPKKGP